MEETPVVEIEQAGMRAGAVAAREAGGTLVDPRPAAVGSIRNAFDRFPKLGKVLPALGYSDEQLMELEKSINAVECDAVVLGTPSDITKMIRITRPVARVRFEASEVGPERLEAVIRANTRLSVAI